ncbi:uncharacterized protein PpBr36_10750 [Pyricularia pennisetigena]|uniref:uncharacterized protein n=1 Tax=Pyricularia pennisetigena TaxID=1578925 RepID=UPI00114E86C6|nr:uncharacterized protein PpBr36_10750 [Pyricularia pennisetigena]TLS20879.1 hypothetical protein PpBr36_10750 [Pyricularia pennisetigena]
MQIKLIISFLLVGAMAAPMPPPAGTDVHAHLQARAPGLPSGDTDSQKSDGHSRARTWFHRHSDHNSGSTSDDEEPQPQRRTSPKLPQPHSAGQRTHTTIVQASAGGGRF